MPYGFGLADWDKLLTDAELDLFFQQIRIMNEATSFTLFLHTNIKDISRVWQKMETEGYHHVHNIFVYKPNHNTTGTHQYLNAIDKIVVGYYPAREQAKPHFDDPNPLLRHNLMYTHTVHQRSSNAASGKHGSINITEKHPSVATQIGRIHSTPGGHALVIGAGSGAEVVGFNRAGLRVTAIEVDPTQFTAVCARLVDESANSEAYDEVSTRQLQEIAEHRQMTCKFGVHADPKANRLKQLPKKVLKPPGSATTSSSSSSSSSSSGTDTKCVSCGQSVSDEKVGVCPMLACANKVIHARCMLECKTDCGLQFCSSACRDSHDHPPTEGQLKGSESAQAPVPPKVPLSPAKRTRTSNRKRDGEGKDKGSKSN